eukprot:1318734-Amorphochlora_amoeboformis.AAC.1
MPTSSSRFHLVGCSNVLRERCALSRRPETQKKVQFPQPEGLVPQERSFGVFWDERSSWNQQMGPPLGGYAYVAGWPNFPLLIPPSAGGRFLLGKISETDMEGIFQEILKEIKTRPLILKRKTSKNPTRVHTCMAGRQTIKPPRPRRPVEKYGVCILVVICAGVWGQKEGYSLRGGIMAKR